MEAKLTIDLDFESWFDNDIEPKTPQEWQTFFQQYLPIESSVIGIEDESGCRLVSLNKIVVTLTNIH